MRDKLEKILSDALFYTFDEEACVSTLDIKKSVDNLLAAGVIVPPCKIGDTAYVLIKTDRPEYEYKKGVNKIVVRHIRIRSDGIFVSDFWGFMNWKIGERAFLTKKEAEEVLEES